MRRHLATIVLAIACLAGLVAVGNAGPEVDEQHSVQHERPVRVALVERAPPTRDHVFHGVTRPAERALVAFPLGGRVIARRVEVGSTVQAGDPVAELDPAPYRNQVDAARASIDEIETRLAQLEREADRARTLIEAQIGNEQTLDQLISEREALQAGRRAADARLAEARRQLGEALLRAPIGGTVAEVFVNPGEVVGPGSPVATISGLNLVEVEFDVPESVFTHLAEGQHVAVALPLSAGRTVDATITGVSRSAASRGRLYPVVAQLSSGDGLAPGMAAAVRVAVPQSDALLVPIAAVLDPTGGRPSVFVVRGAEVHSVPVRAVGLIGDSVRVQAELSPGDEVVVTGHAQLSDGIRVEVAR